MASVYTLFGNVGLFAYNMDGTPAWRRPAPARATRNGWGTAASPVLHDGRLYVLDENEEQSSLAAIDARTGTDVWRVERPRETNRATPFVWRHSQRTEIVVSATSGVQWIRSERPRPVDASRDVVDCDPDALRKRRPVHVASGYVGDQNRPVYAIKPGASGDISLGKGETSNAFVAWTLPQAGPCNPSPIVYDGIYYTLLDRGLFTAHDARTGAEMYGRQRIDPAGVGFSASPWAAGGRLSLLNEDGDASVIRAGPKFEVLAKNPSARWRWPAPPSPAAA